MTLRLRLSHVVMQPVLVYDDGEELTPGPELNAVQLPLSKALDMLAGLPGEVERLATQLAEAEPVSPEPQ